MALSSVSVVTNALTLNRFKPARVSQSEKSTLPAAYQEGDVAIDPICKMNVDIATADLISDYNGKRYYFCAKFCMDTFETDPEKYEDVDESLEVEEFPIAIDPICKMDVEKATASLMSTYEGKMFYFCAQYCKDTFEADPEKYKHEDYRS
jgi:Cu+-exporting ATPase